MLRNAPRISLYVLAVLVVGIWRDLAFAGRTDLLRDVLSTVIVIVFGTIVGDTAWSVEEMIFARRGLWPQPRALFVLRVMAMSVGWVMLGHLLKPAIAMLVQIPRVGFEILPTIVIGLEFELRWALLPALVMGAGVGLAVVWVFVRRASGHDRM